MVRDALEDQNELQHTKGGAHTRDSLDAGVPMQQGEASAPVGPEDASSATPTRGDYRGKTGQSSAGNFTTEIIPEEERVPGGPTSRLVAQRPRAAEIGDVPGKKGGVDS